MSETCNIESDPKESFLTSILESETIDSRTESDVSSTKSSVLNSIVPNEELTDAQKKEMTDRLFNASEGVIKQWISKFVNKPETELFDMVPTDIPIIFAPSAKTQNKYLHLTLGLVPANYKIDMPYEIWAEESVKESINFIKQSISVVYGSVVKTMESPGISNDYMLMWDPEFMVFAPEYFPDIKKKYDFLQYVNNIMNDIKPSLPEDKIKEWVEDNANLLKDLEETKEELYATNFYKIRDEKEIEYAEFPRIGIIPIFTDTVQMAKVNNPLVKDMETIDVKEFTDLLNKLKIKSGFSSEVPPETQTDVLPETQTEPQLESLDTSMLNSKDNDECKYNTPEIESDSELDPELALQAAAKQEEIRNRVISLMDSIALD